MRQERTPIARWRRSRVMMADHEAPGARTSARADGSAHQHQRRSCGADPDNHPHSSNQCRLLVNRQRGDKGKRQR